MEIDDNFLKEVGLSVMPEEQKKAFLDYVEEELEVRVGRKISEGMSDEEMLEFEAMSDDGSVLAWLEKNRPNYREIVLETVEELKREISGNREKILG